MLGEVGDFFVLDINGMLGVFISVLGIVDFFREFGLLGYFLY